MSLELTLAEIVKSDPRFSQHLTLVHLSGNEKVSGQCICRLKEDSALSSISAWQHDRQEDCRTTGRRGCERCNRLPTDWQGPLYWQAGATTHWHITNVLITTYESLSGTNLSGPLPTLVLSSLWSLWPRHTTEIHSINLIDELKKRQKQHYI